MTTEAILEILAWATALAGFLPLAPHLDRVALVLFPLALAVRWIGRRKGFFPGGMLLTGISLVLFAYYFLQAGRQNVVAPASGLLASLLAVRLAAERSGRHFLQITALSLFCLAASSLYSLNLSFLVFLVLLLLLASCSLVFLTFHARLSGALVPKRLLKRGIQAGLLMPLASLPLLLLFFGILPRTQVPLWNFNVGTGATGFTERVTPGATAAVPESRRVAFRVEMPEVPRTSLYWRTIVLNAVSGDTWVREEPPGRLSRPAPQGTLVQKFQLEPGTSRYLPALNLPVVIKGVRATLSADGVATRPYLSGRKTDYEALSAAGAGATDVVAKPSWYLRLPPVSGRIAALALRLQKAGDAAAIVRRLEDFYRTSGFIYATSSLPTGRNAVETFLFERRRGQCELYATSAAVLLRTAGVPARLVGGYIGGDYVPAGGYYVVGDDGAHLWVEALVAGKWVSLDPTAWSSGFDRSTRGLHTGWRRLLLVADMLDYYWTSAVVTYDLERQIALVSAAGSRASALEIPSRKWFFLLLALLPATLLLRGKGRTRRTREERLIADFLDVLHRRGVVLRPSQGLFSAATACDDADIELFQRIYCAAVYHDRHLTDAEYRRLACLLKEIRRKKKPVSSPPREG